MTGCDGMSYSMRIVHPAAALYTLAVREISLVSVISQMVNVFVLAIGWTRHRIICPICQAFLPCFDETDSFFSWHLLQMVWFLLII